MPDSNSERRGEEQHPTCPVCGHGLPPHAGLRRCPGCGHRTLWTQPRASPSLGTVLFNARLCGIIIGIETSCIGFLGLGYRVPAPCGIVLAAAAVPLLTYLVAGAIAFRVAPESRREYVIFLLATAAGLLIALIAAVSGLSAPGLLLALAVAGGALAYRPLSRIVLPDDAQ